MCDYIATKTLSNVTIQENGIIRNSKGTIIASLVGDVEFESEHLNVDDNVESAFNVIGNAMVKDDPSKLGSYAHSWHCNIAMACYDAILAHDDQVDFAHKVGNDAASRFMKLCFNIETTNEQTK